MLTVALPVWNSKDIAWLCMESLCNQIKPESDWELIVFEEKHHNALGKTWFEEYLCRLKGCKRVLYLTSDDKVPLPQKWVEIAQASSWDSEAFLMCAADNYYHQWMLRDVEAAIKEADWCLMTKGFFYDFNMDRVFYYQYNGIVGLHMAAKTHMVRKFEKDDRDRGVDSWFSQQMMKVAHDSGVLLKCFIDGTEHFKHTVCTNGYNNISTGRVNLFKTYTHPFYPTDVKLDEIVPEDVYSRMKTLCQK